MGNGDEIRDLSLDLHFMVDATKRLHGFLVHDWFTRYLAQLTRNFQRLSDYRLLGREDWLPSPACDYKMALDIDSLDTEPLTDAAGLYFLIYWHHKTSNGKIMNDRSAARVLYLRGFEYQTEIEFDGITAITMTLPDSSLFTRGLHDATRSRGLGLIGVLAPEDIYIEHFDAKHWFDVADASRIQDIANDSPSFVYVNANTWQEQVTSLLDRVDYFVVLLSSLTQGALWEIDLLRARGLQASTTIVFDLDEGDANGPVRELDSAVASRFDATVSWPAASVPDTTRSVEEWHQLLAAEFRVVTKADFFNHFDETARLIQEVHRSSSEEERHRPVDFRFFPAVSSVEVSRLEEYARRLVAVSRTIAEKRQITNLPWFLNLVQLAVIASLIVGRHEDAGRALARYAAALQVLKERFLAAGYSPRRVDPSAPPLEEELEGAALLVNRMSWTFLTVGPSDDFNDNRDIASQITREEHDVVSPAVNDFFDRLIEARR